MTRYGNSNGDRAKFEAFKYLLTSFPPMPLGRYRSQLIYRTPGDLYKKGYDIEYKNE